MRRTIIEEPSRLVGRLIPARCLGRSDLAVTLALSLGVGCGPSVAQPAREARAPAVAEDPMPYAPPAERSVGDGSLRTEQALYAAEGADVAREVALRFLEAAHANDTDALLALLADPAYRIGERNMFRPQPRAMLLRSLNAVRPGTPRPGSNRPPLRRLIEWEGIEVSPARSSSNTPVPGLYDSDVVVTFPLTPEGRSELATWYGGWRLRARILVRTRQPAAVLGF